MNVDLLLTELLAHHAYDDGATDSGTRDPARRAELRAMLVAAFGDPGYDAAEALFFRERFLSDEAIAAGYTVRDVREFADWLEDLVSRGPTP